MLEITAGILFYLMNKNHNMQHICHGSDRMVLQRTEEVSDQKETEKGVLYIHRDEKEILLFCSETAVPFSCILHQPVTSAADSCSVLRIDDPRRNEEHELTNQIHRIWHDFLRLQNDVLRSLLDQKPLQEVLELFRNFFRTPFTVVNREMMLLYEHPDIPVIMTRLMGPNYPEEIVEELLMAREFHDVAKKAEPFYYKMENLGLSAYCINIIWENYYYARLVIYTEEGQERLADGAEQLGEYLADILIQMIRNGSFQMERNPNDRMHLLCSNLAEGQDPKDGEWPSAVAAYHWDPGHTYQVFSLEPYRAEGWDTHIDNTMSIMMRKLEQTWPFSCTGSYGRKILLLVNITLSEGTAGFYTLIQQLTVLLRENVFHAGASSLFHDIALASSAWKEAEAALEIGSGKDPSYWFYRFDDYRLDFYTEAIRKTGIEKTLLIHPAVSILMEHDKTHENELTKTLEQYIKNQGNATKAAQALYIHRTTLFRRLNQIVELTGLHPEDPDQVLQLWISYQLWNHIL